MADHSILQFPPERRRAFLTDEQIEQLEVLGALLTVEQIGDYFGLSRASMFRIFDRQPDARRRYKTGRAKAVAGLAQNVLTRARAGDNACAFFYLKTQGGWRETNRLEVSNPDGSLRAPPSIDPSKLSTSALEELVNAFEAAEGEGEPDTAEAPDPGPAMPEPHEAAHEPPPRASGADEWKPLRREPAVNRPVKKTGTPRKGRR